MQQTRYSHWLLPTALLLWLLPTLGRAQTTTFAYTGSPQTYTVPANVTRLRVVATGAGGGGFSGFSLAQGAQVQATVLVVPGEALTIVVGGRNTSGAGYNGGGPANSSSGGGGGATDLRRASRTDDYLASRNALLVAGGAGGGPSGYDGNKGGTPIGADGINNGAAGTRGGGGATQTAPGAGGSDGAAAGSNNVGGAGASPQGGGGGGGYYGGGGGGANGSGGGGGSSWVTASASDVNYGLASEVSNGSLALTPVTPLNISDLSPRRNAVAAPASGSVQVTFDQALAANSASALRVFSAQRGGLRTATLPATVSGNQLRFTPSNYPFRPGETVQATVTTAAQSSVGGALAAPTVWQFTAATGGSGRGDFGGSTEVSVGSNPYSVAVGDLDGDGDLDLAAVNNRGNSVSVRFNDGQGNFSGGSQVSVGPSSRSVALGDVDGDGDLDLLATSVDDAINSFYVSVRLNDGRGTFSSAQNVGVSARPQSLMLGDVDGDGDLDLATANDNNGSVSVRLNDGRGTFSGGSQVSVGNNPLSVALGDVDGDGDLDLVAALTATSGSVSVRFNDGRGTFSGSTQVSVGSVPLSVVLGDVDGDGDLDLTTANSSGNSVSVRLNDGRGTFGGSQEVSVGNSPQSVALGDVDGDGDVDLTTANESGGTSVRLNDGRGNFSGSQLVPAGGSPQGVALGDVDGDGDLDLLVANFNTNSVSVRLNRAPAPVLTALAPNSGPVGTQVTISGTNLTGATAVSFNGTAASGYQVNATGTSLTVSVPAGASSGNVTVTTPAGTSNGLAFTVTPAITSFAPTSGPVGTSVTLTGTSLTGATAVSFGGTAATTFAVANSTTITATVPSGATTGPLSVTTPAGTATSATDFTVTATPPTLTTQVRDEFTLSNGAALGGQNLQDGGNAITDKGVVYGLASAGTPTLGASGSTRQSAGQGGTASYTLSVSGLQPSTTYAVRAYATNAVGTGYGDLRQFMTLAAPSTAAPVVQQPAAGSFVNTATPTYSGTAPNNATVTIYVDGTSIGTATARDLGSGGAFSLAQPAGQPLGEGAHQVYATAQGRNGATVSAPSATVSFTVDVTAPTVTLSSSNGASGSSTSTTPLSFTATFSEPVTNFTTSGITVTNGTVSSGPTAGSGSSYSFQVTPTTAGTATSVTIAAGAAQDRASNASVASSPYTLTYRPAMVMLVPSSLPGATVGLAYSQTITASGGTSLYVFAVGSGQLPAGLTLTSGGLLSGTPTASGNFSFVLTATDANQVQGRQTYTLAVNAATATVSTAAPAAITSTSATLGGMVSNGGGSPVTARGVVYSASNAQPTLGGSGTTTAPSSSGGLGSFTVDVANLTPSTTYAVRAYATNGVGTSYGAARSFTTAATPVTATPVVVTPATGSTTSASPVVLIRATPNSLVTVYLNGTSGGTYTVSASGDVAFRYSSLTQGTYTLYVTAQSSGAAVSAPSNTVTFTVDATAPTVTLSSSTGPSGSTTSAMPLAFTATFSEPVTGFSASGITVSNGSVTSGPTAGSGNSYSFQVTPTTAGTATTVVIAAGAAQDAVGNPSVASAPYSLTYTAPTPTAVTVLYENGDGDAFDRTVDPFLQLVNRTSAAIPYQELTVRYYLTVENFAPVQATIGYAALGTGDVQARYVALPQPAQGALGYIEYSFTSAKALGAGASSGVILSHIHTQTYGLLDETDDYSYGTNTTRYLPTDRITVYRNGVLVGGVEPAPIRAAVQLQALSANQTTEDVRPTLDVVLQVNSLDNSPVAYQDLSVRYWFTPDGPSPVQATVGYAQLGSRNVPLTLSQAGSQPYAELRFAPGLGNLAPLSSTGQLILHFNKQDYSNFVQSNDYSFRLDTRLAVNPRVTVYWRGQLVYGQEPSGAQPAAASARTSAAASVVAAASSEILPTVLEAYPNPFAGQTQLHFRPASSGPARLQVYNALGQVVLTGFEGLVQAGHDYEAPLAGAALPPGVYLVRLQLAGQVQTLRLLHTR